jgi:phosphoglycolate phosphatase-like HAD superfamily hydrolase
MNNLGQLIFDMDGTLIDDIEVQAEIFASIAARVFDVSLPQAKAYYIESAGQPLGRQFAAMARRGNAHPSPPGQIGSLVQAFDAELRQTEPRLYPETRASLRLLNEAGYELFVSSGATQETVDLKLRTTEIYDQFILRLGSNSDEDFVKGRPHFARIRQESGLEPGPFRRSSIFVGDSLHDIEVGQEEGLMTAGRVGTFSQDELQDAQADFVFYDLSQLIDLLRASDPVDGFVHVSDLRRTQK